jgi:uncharacterized OB-fold protein
MKVPGEAYRTERAEQLEDSRHSVLIGSGCTWCGTKAFPPAKICAECLSEDLVPVRLSSEGTLYSFSVVHVAPKRWEVPYAVGYVDLPEGVRIFAHLDARPEQLRLDGKVRFRAVEAGEYSGGPMPGPRFAPVE